MVFIIDIWKWTVGESVATGGVGQPCSIGWQLGTQEYINT